ncbi:MAG: DNA polymerase III subunit alpha [Coxiellaceae bacterium]|nr:DNA polymerase III subunit alpha [Coxiellaceae bacterium]
MVSEFVHLKVHSEYSMVDGLPTVGVLASATHKAGMNALAITDHFGLYGLVKFFSKALKQGVKPIVGVDLLMSSPEDQTISTVTVLCQNMQGYLNVMQLISKGFVEGQASGQPLIEWDWLVELSEGLLILSAGPYGDIGQAIIAKDKALADKRIKRWQQVFSGRYYLELHRTERENDEICVAGSVKLAHQFNIPVVATNDVRFIHTDDFHAHEARVCIHDGHVLDDHRRVVRYSKQQYLKSAEEMTALFADIPEAISNSVEIAKRCTVALELGRVCLPQFPVPDGLTIEQYFRQVSQEGLIKRMGEGYASDYDDRLNIELDVINEMGFPGYFLIVADFIAWAKQQKIPVGPGRGSGAGSLVAYALGITELDPLEHELLFERFLNPERVSMPDFDIDFCMERRDRVIEYVADHYGRDCVSQIITFGTMAAKAVVRDVGRVMGMPYGFVDKLAKLIPFEIGMTLQKALEQEDELMKRYQQEDEVRSLIDLAMKLEGVTRNAGKHAGGVVIAPTKLSDFSPLYCEAEGASIVTQYDKNDVESVGLVKFDFLGLRTLTIIDWALTTINRKQAQLNQPLVDIDKIPLKDTKPFDLLKACETSAVFQLESRGMKDLIRRLQPDSFEEITALVALFRPGPLQSGMVDDFIDRKHGRAKVEYPHPKLEPILSPTYGVILYQEQVMQIAQVLAGYSLGGADILRRAMGKKKPEEMAKQRSIFTEGAKANGVDGDLATHIFDLMEKFAGYGFNKSHSAAYALIAYQTAWLKAHFPAEFMAAVLSSDMDNTDKVVSFYEECMRMQLKVVSPNINKGIHHFSVNADGDIEYGLGAVKGVGQAVVEMIVDAREAEGDYQSLFDLCLRCDVRKLNRRALEAFIAAGALDCFNQPRGVLSASINAAIKNADQHHKNELVGQNDMFGSSSESDESACVVSYTDAPAWPTKLRLENEKSALGMYLSGHPMQVYQKEIKAFTSATINKLDPSSSKKAVFAGMIISVRNIITKSGRRMAIVGLEDHTGKMDITVFSNIFDSTREILFKDNVIVVKGEVSNDDFTGGVKCVADEITALSQARERLAKHIMIEVHAKQEIDQLLARLPHVIKPYTGGACPIVINYQTDSAHAELKLGAEWQVTPSDEFLEKLAELCQIPAQVRY